MKKFVLFAILLIGTDFWFVYVHLANNGFFNRNGVFSPVAANQGFLQGFILIVPSLLLYLAMWNLIDKVRKSKPKINRRFYISPEERRHQELLEAIRESNDRY